jgi:hypothetical protein
VPTVNLATGVTGTLPVGNGGTGQTSLTSNNVILGNGGSAVQFVAPGTNGNVLTSNGTTWTSAAAAGGAWNFITSVTANNSATVDVEWTNGTYDVYKIIFEELRPDTNSQSVRVRFKIAGSYITASNYYGTLAFMDNSAASTSYGNTNGLTSYRFMDSIGNGTMNSAGGEITIFNAPSTSLRKYIRYINVRDSYGAGDGAYYYADWGAAGVANLASYYQNAMTGIRFFMESGNMVTGTFRLYGIKNS